jgi:hypothetical protein
MVIEDGATELLIESRGERADIADRITLISTLSDLGRQDVVYRWEDKSAAELWLVDAACGAIGAYLCGSEPWWFRQLQNAGVLVP